MAGCRREMCGLGAAAAAALWRMPQMRTCCCNAAPEETYTLAATRLQHPVWKRLHRHASRLLVRPARPEAAPPARLPQHHRPDPRQLGPPPAHQPVSHQGAGARRARQATVRLRTGATCGARTCRSSQRPFGPLPTTQDAGRHTGHRLRAPRAGKRSEPPAGRRRSACLLQRLLCCAEGRASHASPPATGTRLPHLQTTFCSSPGPCPDALPVCGTAR